MAAGSKPEGNSDPWTGKPAEISDAQACAEHTSQKAMGVAYEGHRNPMFWLSLRVGFMTLLTLGFYRFQGKTRIRRYAWSSVKPGGVPLEYTGNWAEKLLGFLVAVVILAFYIGVVNLLLMFLSFALLRTDFWAWGVSAAGVLPIILYARYRARRYILARTRWRGIRFGLAPGAWGYCWRALVHWAVTLVSAGIFWPRMTFWLEKYRTDRTTWGNARFLQTGSARMLLGAFFPFWLSLLSIVGTIFLAIWLDDVEFFVWLLVLVPVSGLLWARWRARIFARLNSAKILVTPAGPVGLDAAPRTGRILRIYSLGYLLVGLGLAPLAIVLAMAVTLLSMTLIGANAGNIGVTISSSQTQLTVITIATYFLSFLAWNALTQALVKIPLWRHYAESLRLDPAIHAALATVSQAERDDIEEAEGFAEALDVGAAI